MTQNQFTQFLSDNSCLDKYMKNYNKYRETDFSTWFNLTESKYLISAAFHYPSGEFSLWIDLNNKYKLLLKDLGYAQST